MCTPGYAQGAANQTACMPCPAGTNVSTFGASACLPLAGGPASFCAPGATVANTPQGWLCLSCPVGAFCPDGAPLPLPCPVGFYCPTTGLTFPIGCPAQAYCPAANLTMYVPCPVSLSFQMVASPPGSVSAAQCQTFNVTVSTLAGNGNSNPQDGTGTDAQFSSPFGVAVDPLGNVIVSDWYCTSTVSRCGIRKIAPNMGMDCFFCE